MSDPHNSSIGPRWGALNRDIKAHAIMQTVSHFMNTALDKTVWADLGCGSGGISAHIAPHVKEITGYDPESWQCWSELQKIHSNLRFITESIETLSCESNSIDVVICNQVYEHVPDPEYLIAQIHRILKPNGYCYFAGPNLLFPIEPHVFWPFVHWLPRRFACQLMRLCGSQKILDANSKDYWTLKKWLSAFQIINAVPYILKNPDKYHRNIFTWNTLSLLPPPLIKATTFLSPGFVFILRKI